MSTQTQQKQETAHGQTQREQNGQHRVRTQPAARRMQNYSPGSLLMDPAGYFDELMETQVDEHTVGLLKNMFSKELMLGNIDEGSHEESYWLAQNYVDFVFAEHPDARSTFTGERRAMLSGDYSNKLKPLNGLQEAWIEFAINNFKVILSRSIEGFQQEMNVKSINVNEAHGPGRGGSGGLKSLIPFWG